MQNNNILIPCVRGLADGTDDAMHREAVLAKTPSVEPETGMFLEYITHATKPAKILEIGCGIGVSTRYMAKGAPGAYITAVDYNKGRLEHARNACAGMDRVSFVFADGRDFLRDGNESYDLIFVDSVKREYPIMFYYAYKRLKPGGSLIFDDVFLYGEVFKQDCEISGKYIKAVRVLRTFMNSIKHTYRHVLLPVGGGVLMVTK